MKAAVRDEPGGPGARPGARGVEVRRWPGDGRATDDRIAVEGAVALTYNQAPHVVMMATPADLEDFALGFSLTEGIVAVPEALREVRVLPREDGIELAMRVDAETAARLAGARRNLAGRTGCGLCGAETLAQAVRRPPPVGAGLVVTPDALQRALKAMPAAQPLQAETGAVHAAAWCDREGEVRLLREDVGRHNALDKLIGALARLGGPREPGFVLVSSRASYEMVYKAAAAGIELLAAVSAPTTLAVDLAERCGLTLVGFARPGRHNVYTFPARIVGPPPGAAPAA